MIFCKYNLFLTLFYNIFLAKTSCNLSLCFQFEIKLFSAHNFQFDKVFFFHY